MIKSSFSHFLLLLAAMFLCFECTSTIDDTNTQEEEEYVEIGFKSSFIDYSETPMYPTRAFSDRDVFGVEIRDENGNAYACWLTSDLGKDVVKLMKNKRYACYLVYMPNGRDIVETNSDGTLGLPFCTSAYGTESSPKLNEGVYYGGKHTISFCDQGCVLKKGMQSMGYAYNLWSDVDIYYGITEICSSEDITITINLYRMMFGLNVSVKNLKEGEIKVSETSTLATYVYTLTPSSPSMNKVLELRSMPFYTVFPTPDSLPTDDQMLNWTSGGWINIVYVNPAGEEFLILNKEIETKRLTRYSFAFDMNDFFDNYTSSIQAQIMDDNWSDANLN